MKNKLLSFDAIINKFGNQGEKTGWRYIDIPALLAQQLFPGNKKSFRVSGKIDNVVIEKVATLPMGDGNFILPLNATLRKQLNKKEGQKIILSVKHDDEELPIDADLVECLNEDKVAKKLFYDLPAGHRNYFSNWIASAKTDGTKSKRIAMTLDALVKKMNYGEMIRAAKK